MLPKQSFRPLNLIFIKTNYGAQYFHELSTRSAAHEQFGLLMIIEIFSNIENQIMVFVGGGVKADLDGATLSHATSLRQTYDTNCFV